MSVRVAFTIAPVCDYCGLRLAMPDEHSADIPAGLPPMLIGSQLQQVAEVITAALRSEGTNYSCGEWVPGALPCDAEIKAATR